jgi:hypothetical protein
MRILVYKRTHVGDPNTTGVFGVSDCMGRVRAMKFSAVIGIGGVGSEPINAKIAGKITWIGVGARKKRVGGLRGPIVTFRHFVLFDRRGPFLDKIAPKLAARMYRRHAPRHVCNFVGAERAEIRAILKLAEDASKSTGSMVSKKADRCGCSSL